MAHFHPKQHAHVSEPTGLRRGGAGLQRWHSDEYLLQGGEGEEAGLVPANASTSALTKKK